MKKNIKLAFCAVIMGLFVSCSKNKEIEPDDPSGPTICNIQAYNFFSPLAADSGYVVYKVTASGDANVSKILYYGANSKKIEIKKAKLPFKDSIRVNKNDTLALFVEGKTTNGKITATYRFKSKHSTSDISDECSGEQK